MIFSFLLVTLTHIFHFFVIFIHMPLPLLRFFSERWIFPIWLPRAFVSFFSPFVVLYCTLAKEFIDF